MIQCPTCGGLRFSDNSVAPGCPICDRMKRVDDLDAIERAYIRTGNAGTTSHRIIVRCRKAEAQLAELRAAVQAHRDAIREAQRTSETDPLRSWSDRSAITVAAYERVTQALKESE